MKKKNKGRNVINIKQVQKAIALYVHEKKLSVAVSSWLQKTFLRWLINHYPHVLVVQSVERYKTLVKGKVPDWFRPKDGKIEFIYIDVKHLKFQELLEKCSEFLGSRPQKIEHKFPRMTVEHVLTKWKEEHARLLSQKKRYKETSGEGLEHVFSFENLEIVKFKAEHTELSLEMARESALMQHCLGEFDDDELGEGGYGEYYIKLIQNNEIELYSLRDEKNMPHATIALYKKEEVVWLDQIKGKQNKFPVKRYVPACVAFLNFLKVHYNYHSDTLGMGVVCVDGESKKIEEITNERTQQFLVAYDATLIYELPQPSKATLWLATLRKPSTIEHLKDANDAMKISALLQQSMLMLKVKLSLETTAKEVLKSIQKYEIKGRVFRFIKLQVGRI